MRRKWGSRALRRGKYKNQPTIVDGIRFASKAEAARYGELKQLETAGVISDLKHHTHYPILVNGIKVCEYVDDFNYIKDGSRIIEDVKSTATITPVYRLKKKLLNITQGLIIHEHMLWRRRT